MKASKGFTIIELLVVVAIIAVLTGIVLVNVTQYVNRGKDSSIQGNLSSVLTNASVLFDQEGSYDGLCEHVYYTVPSAAIARAYGTGSTQTCFVQDTLDAWCACSNLKTTAGTTFCVDSTGAKKITETDCATECPSASAAACL